uniref:Uncharacterized protein n=1 Tax=Arundo donax TaxID=35708 RepID=A0A0A9HSW6_ARUDO
MLGSWLVLLSLPQESRPLVSLTRFVGGGKRTRDDSKLNGEAGGVSLSFLFFFSLCRERESRGE